MEDNIEEMLEGLRNLPNFKTAVLDQLKMQFLAAIAELGSCPRDEAESKRGVVLYIADLYENLAGEPVTGELG